MPVGIQRLNAKRSQPNPHIVFIKPLKGPDEDVARQFLERIAAQCVPIMRDHHLSVMTLEEYKPNAEFVGRNFNAGEVVQLVLKARSGRWLPFSYVQMVMMHELAHCRQMNHSRAFWAVRDAYAVHMRRLWAERYTGEGIWGRGAKLGTADGGPPLYERNVVDDDDEAVLHDHLCGGTYQSRGRKRKALKQKPVLTYREREDRRIRRKFGVNGVALGDDLAERQKLEAAQASSGSAASGKGSGKTGNTTGGRATAAAAGAPKTKTEQKRLATKPRVAVSKRGRDLRAAAALARFEQNQAEQKQEVKEGKERHGEDGDEDSDALESIKRDEDDEFYLETDSGEEGDEYEGGPDQPESAGPDAVDIDGSRLLDGQGRGMVRVCEGESAADDSDAKREMRELMQTAKWGGDAGSRAQQKQASQKEENRERPLSSIPSWSQPAKRVAAAAGTPIRNVAKQEAATSGGQRQTVPRAKSEQVKGERREVHLSDIPRAELPLPVVDDNCPVCSFANDPQAITCTICGHVLHAEVVPGAWHCQSASCRASNGVRYLNAGDCGVCGVCGQRRGATDG